MKLNKLNSLAEELIKKGQYEEAIEALKHSIRLASDLDIHFYINMAQSLYDAKVHKYAKILLATIADVSSTDEVYFILADIACTEKENLEAITHYEKAFSLFDGKNKNLEVYKKAFNMAIDLNLIDRALNIAKYTLDLFNVDKDILLFLASYNVKNENYKEAIVFYNVLFTNKMLDHNSCYSYASCLHSLKQYQEAEDMYLLALELYPSSEDLSYLKKLREVSLADNYDDIAKSKREYMSKVAAEPDYSSYYHLGNLEYIDGNYDKALEYYKTSKEIYEDIIS